SLNIGQLNILTVLDRATEPLTMGALGQAVSVLPANLTGVVDGLVGRGYVERIPNPSDRRSLLIRIGKGGRSFLRKFLPGHWAHLQHLMSDMTPAQRRQLQSLLGKFLESIEQNGKDASSGVQAARTRRPARRGGAVPT
ncbi:MAG: hypothetical protein QOE74_3716, partial [Mycobacterium sp.]|nr:hypothetical protein [Mycobacterium sp.]